ncbi:MAG: hypothetical protein GXP58_11670 [Deltaproteobacteria bacterium]|nr:hypothetical protein [Deltaproteobacteria bacterium]
MSLRRALNKWVNRKYFLWRVAVREYPLEYYLDKMKTGKVFSFSRYGDGEWNAIWGRDGKNSDGHTYFPELGERLRRSLLLPYNYFYSLGAQCMTHDGPAIAGYLKRNCINLIWHDCDVFHRACMQGKLYPLIQQLRTMDVLFVGPNHLRKVNRILFPYCHFIEVPSKNCFLKVNEVEEEILRYAEKQGKMVIAFSASMASNVMIYDLFPTIGHDHWLIDFGSLWDIFVGVKSRGYHTRLDWGSIIDNNLGVS